MMNVVLGERMAAEVARLVPGVRLRVIANWADGAGQLVNAAFLNNLDAQVNANTAAIAALGGGGGGGGGITVANHPTLANVVRITTP